MTDTDYVGAIRTWREKYQNGLRAPDSWLSLTGLFMLDEGEYRVGSDPGSDVVLPDSAPAKLGVLRFANTAATLEITCAETVKIDGVIMQRAHLVDNSAGAPTLATVGSVIFFIHAFSGMHAVRVKDTANPAREAFPGCVWFDVDPRYTVRGRFVPNAAPRVFTVTTSRDTPDDYASIGTVEFELNGQALRLHAETAGRDNALFIVFRDATSGKQTYGSSRYLMANCSPDGTVDLDFNKAFNPPCALSSFATCKLAPPENVLSVAIEAGERVRVEHKH